MSNMNIAVICPSEIAFRRFMPALIEVKEFKYIGIGVCSKEERFGAKPKLTEQEMDSILRVERDKANKFKDIYGGKIFESYLDVVTSKEVDAVYIPLPPALHYKWARLALENGKHVLVEKPSTTSFEDSRSLVEIAKKNNLVLHENYMFLFHSQLVDIKKIVDSGEIGSPRLYSIKFGFPPRTQNDFRYDKSLGGGALIDAGGYTLRYATTILGKDVKILSSRMNYIDGYEVDMFGSAMLANQYNKVAFVSFGMSNDYKCDIEVWGSEGTLTSRRVLTAPAGFEPTAEISKNGVISTVRLSSDDAFKKSILHFLKSMRNNSIRNENYDNILLQASLVDEFKKKAEE